jgi:hypothetical protein
MLHANTLHFASLTLMSDEFALQWPALWTKLGTGLG